MIPFLYWRRLDPKELTFSSITNRPRDYYKENRKRFPWSSRAFIQGPCGWINNLFITIRPVLVFCTSKRLLAEWKGRWSSAGTRSTDRDRAHSSLVKGHHLWDHWHLAANYFLSFKSGHQCRAQSWGPIGPAANFFHNPLILLPVQVLKKCSRPRCTLSYHGRMAAKNTSPFQSFV